MERSEPALEVCVENLSGLHAACAGGADRIELCSALSLGGLTPSAGLLHLAAQSPLPIFVMIRPRAGDFIFSPDEEDMMSRDIEAVASNGLSGVVLGAAKPDGHLDTDALGRLLDHARAQGIHHATLHRVFDLSPDPLRSLEEAITLGFDSILTSGSARTAEAGKIMLRTLREKASNRIVIMAGGGVRPRNAVSLLAETGVHALHSSCRDISSPGMTPPSIDALQFGARPDETSSVVVHALRTAIRNFVSTGEK